MKFNRLLSFCLLAFLLSSACGASVLIALSAPRDDMEARLAVANDPGSAKQILDDRAVVEALQEKLRALTPGRLTSIFLPVKNPGAPAGGTLSKPFVPGGYALPVCLQPALGFPGIGYKGGGENFFLPMGEIGGAVMFPTGDGAHISALVIYLKIDDTFTPLAKRADYPERQKWEAGRMEQLQVLVDELLKK